MLIAISNNVSAQMQPPMSGQLLTNIGDIKLKSKIPLLYDSRTQLKDTVYITIEKCIYDSVKSTYVAGDTAYVTDALAPTI